MTIQQYYQQEADLNLNGSIVSAGILSVLLAAGIVFSWFVPLQVIIAPYLLMCFLYYSQYLVYRSRSRACEGPVRLYNEDEFFSINSFLIVFAPAPAVRMLFFTPDGIMAGELKEMDPGNWRWLLPSFLDKKLAKTFGLYDRSGKLQAKITTKGRYMKLFDSKGELVGFFYPKSSSMGTSALSGGRKLVIHGQTGFSDLIFKNAGGTAISKLQKGWMPLEWNRFFKESGTPVLTFDYCSSIPERIAVFAALVKRYEYFNH